MNRAVRKGLLHNRVLSMCVLVVFIPLQVDLGYEEGRAGSEFARNGRPGNLKLTIPEWHMKCVETMTHVAASIGFSWEPYVMSLSADVQKWVKEYLALKHTLLFVLGMLVFR